MKLEIEFAELEDGSLAELIEDPESTWRTVLAVWRNGEVTYADKQKFRNRNLVPIPRYHPLLTGVRLPRGVLPYHSVSSLLTSVEYFLHWCFDFQGSYSEVLANFVLSTWLIDRLPLAPYVSIVGLPQSGKSTLLKVLSLVCRRSLLTADISSAAF